MAYIMVGRGFTTQDLKRSIICACGGYLTPAYFQAWELDLDELIQVIELTADINEGPSSEVDLGTMLE